MGRCVYTGWAWGVEDRWRLCFQVPVVVLSLATVSCILILVSTINIVASEPILNAGNAGDAPPVAFAPVNATSHDRSLPQHNGLSFLVGWWASLQLLDQRLQRGCLVGGAERVRARGCYLDGQVHSGASARAHAHLVLGIARTPHHEIALGLLAHDGIAVGFAHVVNQPCGRRAIRRTLSAGGGGGAVKPRVGLDRTCTVPPLARAVRTVAGSVSLEVDEGHVMGRGLADLGRTVTLLSLPSALTGVLLPLGRRGRDGRCRQRHAQRRGSAHRHCRQRRRRHAWGRRGTQLLHAVDERVTPGVGHGFCSRRQREFLVGRIHNQLPIVALNKPNVAERNNSADVFLRQTQASGLFRRRDDVVCDPRIGHVHGEPAAVGFLERSRAAFDHPRTLQHSQRRSRKVCW
eukprot:m.918190 g.918190  ORF g.918190 m.918190 type:complete len:404 (+) comp23741_c0_seq2:198-1409(+)